MTTRVNREMPENARKNHRGSHLPLGGSYRPLAAARANGMSFHWPHRLAKYSGSKPLCQRINLIFFAFFNEAENFRMYLILLAYSLGKILRRSEMTTGGKIFSKRPRLVPRKPRWLAFPMARVRRRLHQPLPGASASPARPRARARCCSATPR